MDQVQPLHRRYLVMLIAPCCGMALVDGSKRPGNLIFLKVRTWPAAFDTKAILKEKFLDRSRVKKALRQKKDLSFAKTLTPHNVKIALGLLWLKLGIE